MLKNVFVLGLDEDNFETFSTLPQSGEYSFHPLLSRDELVQGEIRWEELLDKAQTQLDSFEGTVDAIVGYWDFPVSSMVPILCQRRGLPCADLEAVLKCEHKYWSRLEQRRSIDEYPRFALVGLDSEQPPAELTYPLWLKPVKAFSSELAFKVKDDEQFRSALTDIRAGIGRVGAPFDAALSYADLPEEISAIGGQACLAEEAVTGRQVTVEGYNDGQEFRVYGVIDSHNYEGMPSFERYQYPSVLPADVLDRLVSVSERVITQIGLRSVFNIEYFWEPDSGDIHLLEINPRQSQSHALLFEQVDGVPNHKCMLDMALGKAPDFPHRQGSYAMAAKWFYRRFEDGIVGHCPTADEIAAIERDFPGVSVEVEVDEGVRLSDLSEQDSYSFNLAVVHVAADDEPALRRKFQQAVEALPFEFEEA